MEAEFDKVLEKLAYNLNLAYDLLSRIDAGESMKGIMTGISAGCPSVKPHAEKSAQLQDEINQNYICGDPKYISAISTLQTKFGHIDPVQDILKKVYQKCPALKPQAPSSHTEFTF